jgi:hypothetical protein
MPILVVSVPDPDPTKKVRTRHDPDLQHCSHEIFFLLLNHLPGLDFHGDIRQHRHLLLEARKQEHKIHMGFL